jgi:hypothetical protein
MFDSFRKLAAFSIYVCYNANILWYLHEETMVQVSRESAWCTSHQRNKHGELVNQRTFIYTNGF